MVAAIMTQFFSFFFYSIPLLACLQAAYSSVPPLQCHYRGKAQREKIRTNSNGNHPVFTSHRFVFQIENASFHIHILDSSKHNKNVSALQRRFFFFLLQPRFGRWVSYFSLLFNWVGYVSLLIKCCAIAILVLEHQARPQYLALTLELQQKKREEEWKKYNENIIPKCLPSEQ